MKKSVLGAILAICFIALLAYFIPLSTAQLNLYLTGKVLYKSSNKPVSSVWVLLVKSGENLSRSLTGDDGRYYISGLKKGSYEIVVLKNKQELFRSKIRLSDNRTFDITL